MIELKAKTIFDVLFLDRDPDFDPRLPWYFNGDVHKSAIELEETYKSQIKHLCERYPNEKLNLKKNENRLIEIWEDYYNKFEWQKLMWGEKHINNLRFNFELIFKLIIENSKILAFRDDEISREISDHEMFERCAISIHNRYINLLTESLQKHSIIRPLSCRWKWGQEVLIEWICNTIEDEVDLDISKNDIHVKLDELNKKNDIWELKEVKYTLKNYNEIERMLLVKLSEYSKNDRVVNKKKGYKTLIANVYEEVYYEYKTQFYRRRFISEFYYLIFKVFHHLSPKELPKKSLIKIIEK